MPIHKSETSIPQPAIPDTYVELEEIPAIRVRADMDRGGPSAAMSLLESKLPTLKRRRFYGIFRVRPEGEEYYACAARVEADDPDKMGVEAGVIPGGRYARRKVPNWEEVVRGGRLPQLYQDMLRAHEHEVEADRFSLEFYRSQAELLLLLPVK